MKKWKWAEQKRASYFCLRVSNEELKELKKRGGSPWLREIFLKAVREDKQRKE
jgi:hypothetical protein